MGEVQSNEYALLYGSPVPGYEAPQFTVEPAARVALVLGSIVADAWQQSNSEANDDDESTMKGLLETRNLDGRCLGPRVSEDALVDGVVPDLWLHQFRTFRSLQGIGTKRQSILRNRRRRSRQSGVTSE